MKEKQKQKQNKNAGVWVGAYKLYQNDWYWDVWYFMKNNTYHFVIRDFVYLCFELKKKGTYVNLLIWWFEDNWLNIASRSFCHSN